MRRTVTGAAALVVSALLLTACGGGADDAGKDGSAPGGGNASEAPGKPADGAKDEAGSGKEKSGEVTRHVTLEVTGKGSTQIVYALGENGTEQVTLPWKKTEDITLTPAEQKVGSLVTLVPGSVRGSDGRLKAASCTITVDGEKVADNDDGASPKGCTYKLT